MGDAVGFDRFPEQGRYLGETVVVCFDYDTSQTMLGVVVRDDTTEPGLMIVRLNDGRHVLSTECQWHPGHNPQLAKPKGI